VEGALPRPRLRLGCGPSHGAVCVHRKAALAIFSCKLAGQVKPPAGSRRGCSSALLGAGLVRALAGSAVTDEADVAAVATCVFRQVIVARDAERGARAAGAARRRC
jgi:hypothetical protein